MTVSSTTGVTATQGQSASSQSKKTGMAALGQADFLKLMTVQMQQQDPFSPVDQKEMLAQMAQFSSLAGIAEVNDTLKSIATRLDAIGSAQTAAARTVSATPTPTTQES